jgi:hypothetical protein
MNEPIIPAVPVPTRKVLASTALSQTAEYLAPHFFVVVDNDVTVDDIMRPAFWAHHASRLKRFNTITIVREDDSLDMDVRVVAAGQGFVRVRPIRIWEDEAVAAARAAEASAAETAPAEIVVLPEEYKITSGRGSFVLTFLPTDERIGSGYKTRTAAINAAREHARNAGIAWPEPTAPALEPTT